MKKMLWFALLLAVGCEECDGNMKGCRNMCAPNPVKEWSKEKGCVCETEAPKDR